MSTKQIHPEYQFWRKRIEGQIRHTIHEHPEWFGLPDADTMDRCVRSMAKRIIGEIVAGSSSCDGASDGGMTTASTRQEDAVQSAVQHPGGLVELWSANP